MNDYLPNTEPIADILLAALSLSEGLSLLSYSIYTVQSYSWLSSILIKFKLYIQYQKTCKNCIDEG